MSIYSFHNPLKHIWVRYNPFSFFFVFLMPWEYMYIEYKTPFANGLVVKSHKFWNWWYQFVNTDYRHNDIAEDFLVFIVLIKYSYLVITVWNGRTIELTVQYKSTCIYTFQTSVFLNLFLWIMFFRFIHYIVSVWSTFYSLKYNIK